jgi:hypothetical protein
VLAREKLGRRHESGLRAGLDGGQHGEEGDQSLAAADVTLQQPHHALGLGHVGRDLRRGEELARRELERQGRQRALLQGTVALGRPAGERAVVMAHQRNRELARQQLVEGEPRARRMRRRQIGFVGRGVHGGERRLPA